MDTQYLLDITLMAFGHIQGRILSQAPMVYACVVPEDRLVITCVHHLQASHAVPVTYVHDQPL